MALITCKDCNGDVSKKASTCPHCGAPLKRKSVGCFGGCLILLILIIVLPVVLTTNSTKKKSKSNITHSSMNNTSRVTLPKYSVYKPNKLLDGSRVGDIIIPNFDLTMNDSELKNMCKLIAEKEAFHIITIYLSVEGQKAQFSDSYAKENPRALDDLICSYATKKNQQGFIGLKRYKAKITITKKTKNLITNEVFIPRSIKGDKGKYYLLEVIQNGHIYKTLHKRIGPDYVDYTRCEIDSKNKLIRDMGYGEGSVSNIKSHTPTKWYSLVKGSSKSDLVNYVLKNFWNKNKKDN